MLVLEGHDKVFIYSISLVGWISFDECCTLFIVGVKPYHMPMSPLEWYRSGILPTHQRETVTIERGAHLKSVI